MTSSDTDQQYFATIAQANCFGREYFEIRASSAALLVIDMQRGFLDADAVFRAPLGDEIIPLVNRLIDVSREASVPVIYTQSDHSFPGGGLVLRKHPRIADTKEFWRGHETFDLTPHLNQPIDGDYQVVKHKYDAFHETDLTALLRNLERDTVIIVGVATEVCCESTARAAYFHDYKVVFVDDATAAFDPAAQEDICSRMDALFGRRISSAKLETILLAGGEESVTS